MNAKILVVDDHPETIRLVALVLEEEGYQVLKAFNGADALIMAGEELPNLILLDVSMPQMDGYETCRRLRANPNLQEVPVIMFTSFAEADDKWTGFEAGANDYLTKPTPPAELLSRVESLLDARSTQSGEGVAVANGRSPAEESVAAAPPADGKPAVPTMAPPPDEIEVAGAGVPAGLVAVLGSRGGAGATTVAINLSASLAQLEHETILVDLDRTQGHVALYLDQTLRPGLNTVARQPEENWEMALKEILVPFAEHWQLVLTEADVTAERAYPQADQVDSLLNPLLKPGHTVVVDIGQVLTPLARAVLARAGQIILCLKPERVSLMSTRLLVRDLLDWGLVAAQIKLLLLEYDGASLPQNLVSEFLGQPVQSISLATAILAQSSNHSQPILAVAPDQPVAKAFLSLAESLQQALESR